MVRGRGINRWAARFSTGLAALGALTGCSSIDLLNTLEPKAGLAITRDIAYADGDRGRLDIYRPRTADGSTPVIVFIYGGNWDSGSKAQYAFAGAALASKGFVTVIPDYRVYPQVR